MNRTVKMVLVLALAVIGMGVVGTTASADAIDETSQYRAAMWYFVPELGDFANELDLAVNTVELKPEMAAELADLAHRGEYLVYDLEGTHAPAGLEATHEQLLFAVRQMTEAAQIAAYDASGARRLMDNEAERFESARRQIRRWLMSGVGIGVIDPMSVEPAGN